MLRSVFGKAVWLGRATSAVVGLAVVLALVVGVSSAALAGNLDPLKIGSLKNAATKTTQLVGKVATGSAFVVKNPSGGSALGLQVNAGQAPLTVNAEAGKAANLDADKLDGKDSGEFLGKTEKAADAAHADQAGSATIAQDAANAQNAERLDGKDSSEFASASHNHDTLYSPRIFAAIRGQNASPIRSSNLQATFKYLGFAGSYEIVFNRDIRSCVYSATLINETAGRGDEAPNGEIGVRPLSTSSQGVSVTTYNSSGARADRDFSIVVHC